SSTISTTPSTRNSSPGRLTTIWAWYKKYGTTRNTEKLCFMGMDCPIKSGQKTGTSCRPSRGWPDKGKRRITSQEIKRKTIRPQCRQGGIALPDIDSEEASYSHPLQITLWCLDFHTLRLILTWRLFAQHGVREYL